jgi:hypothetical protein
MATTTVIELANTDAHSWRLSVAAAAAACNHRSRKYQNTYGSQPHTLNGSVIVWGRGLLQLHSTCALTTENRGLVTSVHVLFYSLAPAQSNIRKIISAHGYNQHGQVCSS